MYRDAIAAYNQEHPSSPFIPQSGSDYDIKWVDYPTSMTHNFGTNEVLRCLIDNRIPPEWIDHSYLYGLHFMGNNFADSSMHFDYYRSINEMRLTSLARHGIPKAIPEWDGWRYPSIDDHLHLMRIIDRETESGFDYGASGMWSLIGESPFFTRLIDAPKEHRYSLNLTPEDIVLNHDGLYKVSVATTAQEYLEQHPSEVVNPTSSSITKPAEASSSSARQTSMAQVPPDANLASSSSNNPSARRAKLQPYQIAEVDTFMKASMNTQLGLMFVDIQAMKSEVTHVLIHQPWFTVDEALHKTISAYSLGVLLSEKLREYKRSSTDIVLAIIQNNHANIPSNLDQDPYALSIVKAAISEALTQARSRIKKLIRRSIDDNLSIYQLSSKVIEGSQCSVSVPLCARLAALRNVYSECGSSLSYWNDVDVCLAQCRAKAKDNTDGIRKILAKMLKLDRATFGQDSTTIPKHVSLFQQSIDDSL
ncbi:hypothetical protein AGABI2DRAFT_116823 [Agaricus bisporus var. bisporus H97]|uniref:hypothetical protein n=1 Tax=Agaricus bisporus var. bisporus (strain H97 / ATCC MYA-4626 / FGSC 10389) TaxID=936046 RepID=UPI00029F6C57|nr:hypothetical protein AGABI2DRAFT_116823 [Agaricus bisporus var. bisporus H97]EKV47998.1 hypothetical protein AGABI2DRAFT_116823 [Agaricus bisporus var. bisporus H97]